METKFEANWTQWSNDLRIVLMLRFLTFFFGAAKAKEKPRPLKQLNEAFTRGVALDKSRAIKNFMIAFVGVNRIGVHIENWNIKNWIIYQLVDA